MSLFDSLIHEDLLGRSARSNGFQSATVAKREVFIAIRRDGILGDGTRTSPYDGSSPNNLDSILNATLDPTLASPVRFIFGAGVFRTAGSWRNAAPDGPWVGFLSGQEFVGAGMFATTLRLEVPESAPAIVENAGYGVFGPAF